MSALKRKNSKPAPFIMAILKNVRKVQNEYKLKAGEIWDNKWNLVFTNEIGAHRVPGTMLKHCKAIATKIGRPDARFHDLRYTYAVSALKSGDDIKTVQETLGHHAAAFTLDVYGHVTQRMRQDSADRMERYIQSLKTGQ